MIKKAFSIEIKINRSLTEYSVPNEMLTFENACLPFMISSSILGLSPRCLNKAKMKYKVKSNRIVEVSIFVITLISYTK